MLTPNERKTLKHRAHHLNPVVRIGQKGLTDAVQAEIGVALHTHELIKIHVLAKDKLARAEMIERICTEQQAVLIQSIGHMVVVYRKREER